MFTFLRGSSRGRKDDAARTFSPFAGSPETSRHRAVGQHLDDEVDDQAEDEEDEDCRTSPYHRNRQPTSYFDNPDAEVHDEEQEDEDEDGDEDEVDTPLLPMFSAAHLDRLPLYNITHAIRLLIVPKCETTLSWDQLRSPQISQFLVKPIQSQIRTNHFNRATLCALITNCLQFQKEGQLSPGNVGVSKTRALISELLAMRLLKEFTTRELIDALSYDFDPLQGMFPASAGLPAGQRTPIWSAYGMRPNVQAQSPPAKGARVSTIEVAIKAQTKRFLAHPLVVQHLEAIWAGTIVFHSEADNLHRKPSIREERLSRRRVYGTVGEPSASALPADSVLSRKAHSVRTNKRPSAEVQLARRSVTLYNPRDASLFKLSRLRVPRYRQIFNTLSFATMLGLFLAVLVERSLYITPLEVMFWFWSIGYMLDEVVGFTEQGFGLYILSFWNAFDLGILLLFVVYYCLRLYGIVLAEDGKHQIADYAYDVLASTAILLFPRLFSVLDHYRYFSQLLIAFRMMAQDLMAVLVLIFISCSGFFVAFTLSFSDEKTDGRGVAYALFQILMGFTPAAWEKWPTYNILGKVIMTIFLIIGHFLIVTILITVLTNSFIAIVQNANEEHQFLFAVNTISMVKSDALFSYMAPSNAAAWLLSPLRYVMSFRQYVKLNRTVIKVSHFPVLFIIFGYERMILSTNTYVETDLVEKQPYQQSKPVAFSINKAEDVFSPGRRMLREPSVISFRKDRALDEVFRRPFKGSTIRTTPLDMEADRENTGSAVDNWIEVAENEGVEPPIEQPRSVVERLEDRRPPFRRAITSERVGMTRRSRDFSFTAKSMASEPDMMSTVASRRPYKIEEEGEDLLLSNDTLPQETDADGDDENNVESELAGPVTGESALSVIDKENRTPGLKYDEDVYFASSKVGKSPMMQVSSPAAGQESPAIVSGRGNLAHGKMRFKKMAHERQTSTGTTLFAPLPVSGEDSSSTNARKASRPLALRNSNTGGTATPVALNLASGQRTPKLKPLKSRPIMPPRQKTAPGPITGMSFLDTPERSARQHSFYARALDLASEIGDNKWGPSGGIDTGGISGMPASFSEQLMRDRDIQRQREEERRRSEQEEKGMVNRIMLARMHTLEEGFREVLREIKEISRSTANSSRRDSDAEGSQGLMRTSPRKTPPRDVKTRKLQKAVVAVGVSNFNTRGLAEEKRSTGRQSENDGGVEGEAERPGTAVRTPEPRSSGE